MEKEPAGSGPRNENYRGRKSPAEVAGMLLLYQNRRLKAILRTWRRAELGAAIKDFEEAQLGGR